MMSLISLFSVIGGAGFKLLFAHITDYFNKKQDHEHEMDRMRLQGGLEREAHNRACERLRLQSDLGVKEVMVSADAEVQKLEAAAFVEAMKGAIPPPTGIKWVDAWNSVIRPLGATGAYILIGLELYSVQFVMADWHRALVGTIIGFFFASRDLAKAGK